MGGGLMQLVAYGAQDIYLTGNPQITFFKVVYRRHTNFSVESIEQTFNGTPNFGKKASATISRNGDLIHRVLLQVTLEQVNPGTNEFLRWCNWVGEKIIRYVEVEIGGQRIDRHYGEWLHIWSQLTLTPGHDTGYSRMVGNVPSFTNVKTTGSNIASETLFIPLQFWFCRNPGLALPLIALQYHEVKINIEFSDLYDCLLFHSTAANNSYSTNLGTTPNIQSASLWVDYIYLDSDERRRFAQLAHEYLIEQLQYPGEETISVASNKIKLAFNHPVKEIIWVVQKEDAITFKQHFNYTNALDETPFSQDNNLGNNMAYGIAEMLQVSGTGTEIEVNTDKVDSGKNNCSLARIVLNGQDRFAERTGDYFNYVQPFYHHSRTPSPGINVYSFGLKPEEHQPSGTCNFSRIDNANLFLTVTSETLEKNTISLGSGKISVGNSSGAGNAKVRVYAVNYNVLRIMSGMGGLAYSN